MEIEKGEIYDVSTMEFTDNLGTSCRMWILGNLEYLRFDLDTDFAQFSQEDIKTLLPYLQSFAETGRLEPQEPPCKGDSLAEAFKPENLIKVSVEQNVKIYEQEKRIKALEQLVERWRTVVDVVYVNEDLQEKTDQLLGE
jgi:hypothetical protein